MKRGFVVVVLCVMANFAANAQQRPRDVQELTRMLHEFLEGAGRNDAAIHDRFWADDLIYTRSAGVRIGKAELMNGVRSAPPRKPDDPGVTVYTAEDIRIRQYGKAAVVAFRLVATSRKDGKTDVSRFLNTGTFIKRRGRWQAVAWQATAIPPLK